MISDNTPEPFNLPIPLPEQYRRHYVNALGAAKYSGAAALADVLEVARKIQALKTMMLFKAQEKTGKVHSGCLAELLSCVKEVTDAAGALVGVAVRGGVGGNGIAMQQAIRVALVEAAKEAGIETAEVERLIVEAGKMEMIEEETLLPSGQHVQEVYG